MCRKRALAATAQLVPALMLVSALLSAHPALAWGSKPAAAPAATAPDAVKPPESKPKASPEVRAQAERLDPLSRAAFWTSQVDADAKDAEAGVKLASALRGIERYAEAYSAAQSVLVLQPNHVDALLETARAAL